MRDFLGAACSGLCVLHCLALPALVAVGVPAAGVSIIAAESVHIALSLAVVVFAIWAFPSGWRLHRHPLPGVLAVLGVGFVLGVALAPEALEVYLASAAGSALIIAHLLNRHLLNKRISEAASR